MYDKFKTLLDANNPMFVQAGEGKRSPNLIVSTVVLFVLLLLAFGIVAAVLAIGVGEERSDELMDGAFGLIVPFGLLVGLLWLWIRLYERRPFATVGLALRGALAKYLTGFATALVMIAVLVGLMALAGGIEAGAPASYPVGGAAAGGVLLLLFCYAIQGGSEEVVFRGWFMQVVGRRYKPVVGVIASIVAFGAAHEPTTALAIINLVLFGGFLALWALKDGSIWAICGWHSAWNWSLGNVFGLTVTREEPIGGVLFNLHATGADWLTGGSYGPEASLMCTFVMMAGMVVLLLTVKRVSQPAESGDL